MLNSAKKSMNIFCFSDLYPSKVKVHIYVPYSPYTVSFDLPPRTNGNITREFEG